MLSAAHGQPQPAAGDAGSSVTALQDEVATLRSSLQRVEQELAALRSTVRELAVDAGMHEKADGFSFSGQIGHFGNQDWLSARLEGTEAMFSGECRGFDVAGFHSWFLGKVHAVPTSEQHHCEFAVASDGRGCVSLQFDGPCTYQAFSMQEVRRHVLASIEFNQMPVCSDDSDMGSCSDSDESGQYSGSDGYESGGCD